MDGPFRRKNEAEWVAQKVSDTDGVAVAGRSTAASRMAIEVFCSSGLLNAEFLGFASAVPEYASIGSGDLGRLQQKDAQR